MKTADLDFRLLDTAGAAFEFVVIVADGHGEGQEPFEGLLRLLELNGDAAGFDVNAAGQVFEILVHHGDRRFDEQLRLFQASLAQLFQDMGYFAAPFDLMESVVALTESAEAVDQRSAVG